MILTKEQLIILLDMLELQLGYDLDTETKKVYCDLLSNLSVLPLSDEYIIRRK